MKNIAIFGGTGGLGKEMNNAFQKEYNILSIGSKDIDVSDFNQVNNFFNNNSVEIVLNFSGINYDCFMHKYESENYSKIQEQINVNIIGTNNILVACLPKMRKNGYGRIVLMSSILAEVPVISTGIYSGCKGYIDSITKTVALENASKGITCNSIQLGYFDAGLTYRIPEEFREKITSTIPLKRFGKMKELENLLRMLIDTEYITGTNIKMNGGLDF